MAAEGVGRCEEQVSWDKKLGGLYGLNRTDTIHWRVQFKGKRSK